MSETHRTPEPATDEIGFFVDSRATRLAVPPTPPAPVSQTAAAQTPTAQAPTAQTPTAQTPTAQKLAMPAPAPRPEAPAVQVVREQLIDAQRTGLGTAPARTTATTGLRGLLGSLGIRVAPGAAEQQQLDLDSRLRRDETVIRQSTWTRAVSILVANRKGGSGKTPVSLIIGGTLAAVRGGSVCVLEVSDDPGTLTLRAEGSPQLGLGQLVRDVSTIHSAGQLAGYTAPQTSFASVIGSVGDRERLSRDDVVAVSTVVDEYYSIRVMDSGNQVSSSAFAGAVETADALVVPVLNAVDSVLEALALLDGLRAAGGHSALLAERAVILRLTDGRPENPQMMERLDRILAGAGAAHVFTIPYDAHIAERGQITIGQLHPATYRTVASACAAIVQSLQNREG